MSATTSEKDPWPVRTVARKIAEWVDRLRVKFQNMGLMRNTPRVKVGVPEVGDPPRYLHVPHPVGEAGDSKVCAVLAVP